MLGADHRAVTARARAGPGRQDAPSAPSSSDPGTRRSPGATALLGLSLWGLPLGLLAASTSGAPAAEWFVGGSVSQRLVADTNDSLEEDGEPSLGATTALGLDVTALTPTTQWQLETGTSLDLSTSDDDEDQNALNPNFATAVSHNGKYVDTGASFAFAMQPSSAAQFEDTGITEGDATQVSVQLAADAAYAFDPRNRLSVGGFGRITRFTGGSTTLDPTTTYGANLAWAHDISTATQGSLSFGVSRFTAESFENPESVTLSLSAGATRLVNRRLSVDATLGVTGTRTTETRLGGLRESEFSLGALGGLDIAWAPAPDTQLVFAMSHGLEPSSRGELQTTTAVGVGAQHAINSWASAGLDLLLQRQSSGGGFEEGAGEDTERTIASLSPSLAFSLTPDWALQAGYALRLAREPDSDTVSNQVFLTLTRQFDILP